MKSPILGGSAVTRSVNASDNVLVNMYPEATPDGKSQGFLTKCPGLTQATKFATAGGGSCRGMYAMGSYLYIVSGSLLFWIDSTNATISNRTGIAGSTPVSIADNGTQMFIAAGATGYIYNTSTLVFADITDPDFAGATNVVFLDGYFVYNQPNSQKIWVTALYDGTSVAPLDFASAEASPDNIVALRAVRRELWVFGTNSVEVWYNSGGPDFPFAPISGAFNEVGCVAAYSVAILDNSLLWLGSDARGTGIIYRTVGYSAKRISTHAVEQAIQQYTVLSDAVAYSYQQDGHSFYVISFPTDNVTWVYDVATDAWHQRGSFVLGTMNRHRSNCQALFNNQTYVGDYLLPYIYTMSLNTYEDYLDGVVTVYPIKWIRSWRALPTGQNDLKRTAHHSLQLDCESGVGLGTGTPDDMNPQVSLRWSDDGGHTWSNYHTRSMGKIGEYSYRVIWRRLGMTTKLRDRVYEVSGSDPVKVTLIGAEILMSGTNG